MTILLILLILIVGFSLIALKVEMIGLEIISMLIAACLGLYLIFHIISWSTSSYSYNKWVLERESFVETLKESRDNGRELESVAIIKEVAEWNKSLISNKYDNKTFLLGDYVDDRVETLKPIK